MNKEILSAKVAQAIQNDLEEHGKKLDVIAQLIRSATGDDGFFDEDFNYNLGNLIMDWRNEQQSIIENAVQKLEDSKEYTVHRAKMISEGLKKGATLKYWADDIKKVVSKLNEYIDILGKTQCPEELGLLAELNQYLECSK